MKKLLKAQKLQALSREGLALSPVVDFDLDEGEVLYLTGENGAGKSTLLKTLLGLHKSRAGKFEIFCKREQIQYLPQLGNLNFHIPCTLQDMLPETTQPISLLKNLDLTKKWNTASGGERQKVLLAAALLKNPVLLVLDEPFNHVDKDSSLELETSLQEYLISHPQSSLMIVSHRAFVKNWSQVRFV
jgi:ABC-type Mn2+/Zn2+ transport system ATPase subunit